jgi:hypothetical protein
MRMLSQSDGQILISADALTNNPDMSFTNYLIRTNLDGSIDTSFASAGVLTDQNPWMGSTYYANGSSPIVAVDSMGRTLMSLSQAAFGLGSRLVLQIQVLIITMPLISLSLTQPI